MIAARPALEDGPLEVDDGPTSRVILGAGHQGESRRVTIMVFRRTGYRL